MSSTAKFIYFLVAVVTMVCLAAASVAMAQNHAWEAVILFVVSFAIIACAFIVKARLRRSAQSSR